MSDSDDSDEIIQISDRRRRQSQHINNILTIPNNHIDNDIIIIRGIIRPRQIYFQDSDDDDYIDPDNILTNRYLQTSGVLTNTIELPSSDPRTYSKCCICDTNNCNTITNCGHAYCQSCIFKWIIKNVSNATCPICRTPITASSCSRIVIIL
jgi:hypothetical protein